MSGKGDTYRPVDRKRFEVEWLRIFDPIPGPGGVIGQGRRRGQRLTAAHRKPPERRKAKR